MSEKDNNNFEGKFIEPFGCGIPPNAKHIKWEWNPILGCFTADGFPIYPPYDKKTT